MPPTTEQSRNLGRLRKALYLWNMNEHKHRVTPETKERLWREVEEAAYAVYIGGVA